MATERDILPDEDGTRSFGSSALRWLDIFVSGVLSDGTNSRSISDFLRNPNESAVDIDSATNELTLNTEYATNCHAVTEDTEIQLPDTSGWANGTIYRGDLWIKHNGTNTVSFETGWLFARDTEPTFSSGNGDFDHLVITIVKTADMGAIPSIGLAQADVN